MDAGMTPNAPCPRASPIRLQAAGVRRRGRNAELGFQRRDAGFERLVFLTREPCHLLDCLELLALDDVEVAEDFFRLVADHRIDLALDALGGAGGVVHQTPDLVEKPIVGLGHLWSISGRLRTGCSIRQWRSGRRSSRLIWPYDTACCLVMSWFPCNRIDCQSQKNRKTDKRAETPHDRPANRNSDQGRPYHHLHHPSRTRR